MTAPTHIAFGNILFFALADVTGTPVNALTASAVSLSSLIPDVDTPTSAFGRIVFPLARWIEGRWGHRTITHSFLGFLGFGILMLPLLLWRSDIYIPLLIGYISHPLIDCINTTGAGLVWPSEMRVVFPYVQKEPEKFRIVTGSFHEMVLLGMLVAFLCLFYPVGKFGFRRVLHYMLGHPYGAVADYREMAGHYKVKAEVKAIDLLTQKHFSGTYEVLGALGQTTLIIRGDDGDLYTLGLRDDCNYYPKKVRCKQAERITVITQEVDMASRVLGDIRYFLDPTKEQYLYGALKIEGQPNLVYKFRAYNSIFKHHDFVMLNTATWNDIEKAKIDGLYVTNGKMTIKTLLREGQSIDERDLSQIAAAKGGCQKIMIVSFYVQNLDDIIVKENDEIRVGQVLARAQGEIDQAKSMGHDLRDLQEQRRQTKKLTNLSLRRINQDIQREERALTEIRGKEKEARELYEAGVVGIGEYQDLKKKRQEIEYKIEDLKAQWERENESGRIQLLTLDKQVRNLAEEVEERQAGGVIRSKVDGLVTAMHFSNAEQMIKVTLDVLATIGGRKEEDGGV